MREKSIAKNTNMFTGGGSGSEGGRDCRLIDWFYGMSTLVGLFNSPSFFFVA